MQIMLFHITNRRLANDTAISMKSFYVNERNKISLQIKSIKTGRNMSGKLSPFFLRNAILFGRKEIWDLPCPKIAMN